MLCGMNPIHTCQGRPGFSGSPIGFQWGYRRYLFRVALTSVKQWFHDTSTKITCRETSVHYDMSQRLLFGLMQGRHRQRLSGELVILCYFVWWRLHLIILSIVYKCVSQGWRSCQRRSAVLVVGDSGGCHYGNIRCWSRGSRRPLAETCSEIYMHNAYHDIQLTCLSTLLRFNSECCGNGLSLVQCFVIVKTKQWHVSITPRNMMQLSSFSTAYGLKWAVMLGWVLYLKILRE